jgi:peptidoglycan hydrolase CwlO-like protein
MKIILESKHGYDEPVELETELLSMQTQIRDLRKQVSELKKLEDQQEQLEAKIQEEMQYLSQRILKIEDQQAEDHTSFWEGFRSLFKTKKPNIKTSEVDA